MCIRDRPLPFLPRVVGLVTGRDSAAARDVVETARRRWPTVRFDIREVAVQGTTTVTEVCQAPVSYTHLDVYKRQVVLASPATLLAMLRTVAVVWQHDALTEGAKE